MIVISPIMHIVIRSIHNIFTVLFSDKARFEGGGRNKTERDRQKDRAIERDRWGGERGKERALGRAEMTCTVRITICIYGDITIVSDVEKAA